MTRIALTRHETEARLTAVAPAIRALGVVRLALFGSVLRDQARPDSDVDFLVQFAPGQKTLNHFEHWPTFLSRNWGARLNS